MEAGGAAAGEDCGLGDGLGGCDEGCGEAGEGLACGGDGEIGLSALLLDGTPAPSPDMLPVAVLCVAAPVLE